MCMVWTVKDCVSCRWSGAWSICRVLNACLSTESSDVLEHSSRDATAVSASATSSVWPQFMPPCAAWSDHFAAKLS